MSNFDLISKELPIKPKLKSTLWAVPLDENALLMISGYSSLTLRGSSVSDLLPILMPLLDGTRTLEQIATSLPNVDVGVVIGAIRMFHKYRLIEDASFEESMGTSSNRNYYSYQTNFFSFFRENKYELQNKLTSSKIIIVGLGGIGASVATSLSASGVGQITVVDADKVVEADQLLGFFYTGNDVGENRATVLSRRLTEINKDVTIKSVQTIPQSANELADLIAGAEMVVVCRDTIEFELYENINEACLKTRTPWTRGCLETKMGFVGPTVIPHETACYVCFDLRVRSNLNSFEEYVAIRRYLQSSDSKSAELGLLNPAANMIAGYLGVEVLKALTGYTYPSTTSRLLAIDFLTMEATTHEVLKLPRCPACGAHTTHPQMKIWDLSSMPEF